MKRVIVLWAERRFLTVKLGGTYSYQYALRGRLFSGKESPNKLSSTLINIIIIIILLLLLLFVLAFIYRIYTLTLQQIMCLKYSVLQLFCSYNLWHM
jgi:hypothetical protein